MSYSEKDNEERTSLSEVNEPQADYEKAELDPIRHSLSRTYAQRFETMMSLIKIGIMFKNAKIVHQPEMVSKK
jgi:hypothetical protein